GADPPVAVEPAQHERPEPERVPEADQLPLGERRYRERALEPRHRVRDRLGERRGVVRDQRGGNLGVRGGRELYAVTGELVAQLRGVDEVAVVAECDRARTTVVDERL